jgi:hypothetical protein
MGLYLCVFDEFEEELEGVEVGSYEDFDVFRQTVVEVVENGVAGSVCPLLYNHSDCDGEWTSRECEQLIRELNEIERVLKTCPPVPLAPGWKTQVAANARLTPQTLADCFFDVSGEPLIDGIRQLAQLSVDSGHPIVFQ